MEKQEAAKLLMSLGFEDDGTDDTKSNIAACIAGAEWQREQIEYDYDKQLLKQLESQLKLERIRLVSYSMIMDQLDKNPIPDKPFILHKMQIINQHIITRCMVEELENQISLIKITQPETWD